MDVSHFTIEIGSERFKPVIVVGRGRVALELRGTNRTIPIGGRFHSMNQAADFVESRWPFRGFKTT